MVRICYKSLLLLAAVSLMLALSFLTLPAFAPVGLSSANAQGSARLASLVTDIPLSPDFSGDITEYAASVDNSITTISVTPTAVDAGAQIDVNGILITEQQATAIIPLAVGLNTVSITVSDGEVSNVYTISVTRAYSGDAKLKNCKLIPVIYLPRSTQAFMTIY